MGHWLIVAERVAQVIAAKKRSKEAAKRRLLLNSAKQTSCPKNSTRPFIILEYSDVNNVNFLNIFECCEVFSQNEKSTNIIWKPRSVLEQICFRPNQFI